MLNLLVTLNKHYTVRESIQNPKKRYFTSRTNSKLSRVKHLIELSFSSELGIVKRQILSDAVQIRISPSIPGIQRTLSDLYDSCDYQPTEFLQEVRKFNALDEFSKVNSSASLNFIFSLLEDLEAWGAVFEFHKSQLYVSLPNLASSTVDETIKNRIQKSLLRLRGGKSTFETSLTVNEALDMVKNGSIELKAADDGASEMADIFRNGVTTWSMPYRTREGRSRRFVLQVTSNNRTEPLGILEIGDEAPINPSRDSLMGLSTKFDELSAGDLEILANRFANIRMTLRPEGLPSNWNGPVEDLLPVVRDISTEGKGRQGTFKEIGAKKRLSYLARLVLAEASCKGLTSSDGDGFAEGLRVLRDLTVPRINVEMAICGALPPFGPILAGKLVAGMACHPRVRDFVDRDYGVIAKEVFDTQKLKLHLPISGTLLVTTKGLYPGHSSQYNGVRFPAEPGKPNKITKIGDTVGHTTSHLSDSTMKFAVQTLNEQGKKSISKVFGSGGAKRQRTISDAAKALGLPTELVFANISRPVYAYSLVDNLKAVVLFNQKPIWRVSAYSNELDSANYCQSALELWNSRWGAKAAARLSEE